MIDTIMAIPPKGEPLELQSIQLEFNDVRANLMMVNPGDLSFMMKKLCENGLNQANLGNAYAGSATQIQVTRRKQ